MEGLDRLVSESLARHGFDRPLDYRRLRWSRWFRCESVHSLLFVPSQPGVFALAEEIMDLSPATTHVGTAALGCPAEQSSAAVQERPLSGHVGTAAPGSASSTHAGTAAPVPAGSTHVGTAAPVPAGSAHVGTAAPGCPAEQSSAVKEEASLSAATASRDMQERRFSAASIAQQVPAALAPVAPLGGAALQRCDSLPATKAALAAEVAQRRMLAVTQFFEADDMAFILDRMLSTRNPMRARLLSGHYFVRFVVIDDPLQRRSICGALNQWIANSTSSVEKASGIGAHFATSLEINETNVGAVAIGRPPEPSSAALTNTISKHTAPFPSGF